MREDTDMDTRRRPCEEEGGGQGHAFTSWGALKASRPPELWGWEERGREGISVMVSEGTHAAHT